MSTRKVLVAIVAVILSQPALWWNRSVYDVLVHTLWLGSPVALVTFIVALSFVGAGFANSRFGVRILTAASLAIALWLGGGYVLYGLWVGCYESVRHIPDLIAWARKFGLLVEFLVSSAVIAGVIVVGTKLFTFRLRHRSTYGLTEAVAGVAFGVTKVLDPDVRVNGELIGALLTASLYLFVRGLDNVQQGLTKEPFDPWAAWCVAGLRKVAPRICEALLHLLGPRPADN